MKSCWASSNDVSLPGLRSRRNRRQLRVASRQSRKQADLAEANFQTAVLALRRQLNLSSDEPLELVGRLEGFYWQPLDGTEPKPGQESGSIQVPSSLAAAFASERPDVRAAQAGSCMAQSNADLARANRVQNIQVGPFYERDDYGTLFFGLRAQMNLPVFDTGRPLSEQREAEAEHQMITLEQLRSATVEVQTAVERHHAHAESRPASAAIFRGRCPSSCSAFAIYSRRARRTF